MREAGPWETTGPVLTAVSGGVLIVANRSTAEALLLECEQIDSLLDVAGIDGVNDILAAFWRSTDDLSADLARRVSVSDFAEAARTAHALKGSAANVGAQRLAEAARDVETRVKNNDLKAASDALVRLAEIYRDTRAAFEHHLAACA